MRKTPQTVITLDDEIREWAKEEAEKRQQTLSRFIQTLLLERRAGIDGMDELLARNHEVMQQTCAEIREFKEINRQWLELRKQTK